MEWLLPLPQQQSSDGKTAVVGATAVDAVALAQARAEPRALDLEKDSPELEAELLKAIDGPFAPYSAEEMKAIGRRVLGKKQEQ